MSKNLLTALQLLEIVYKTGGNLEEAKDYIYSRVQLGITENDKFLNMFRFYVEMRKI